MARRRGATTVVEVVVVAIGALGLLVLGQLAGTFLAMIFLGVAHSFDARIPPLGFWTTLFLGMALRLLITGGVLFPSSKD